jgi:hypothetical protein
MKLPALLCLALAACTGTGGQGGAMTEAQALRALSQQGYDNLHNLRPSDGGFAADALRAGQPVTVIIDANGIIHTQ